MEWLADPTIWAGLLTLIVLEIVLGIDNLIFIAILADKLPPQHRDKARLLGLGGALVMRLGLLASISWLMSLTTPWVTLYGKEFTGRDVILLLGGMFLLFKATMELHDRLEGDHHDNSSPKSHAGFWGVVAQIMLLDAVFSIDAVITAVGMVDELPVMMTAVIIAIVLMMIASKPLTKFVNAHPTVVILCLGFLMMIGFSLVAEGFGFHIPKGYLYAAIGFSVLIEAFNQWARFNRKRVLIKHSLRNRTANAVLRLMGGQMEMRSSDVAVLASTGSMHEAFNATERSMMRGVLGLAEKPVKYIMTPRTEVESFNLSDPLHTIQQKLVQSPYSRLVVHDGPANEAVGIVQKKDVLNTLLLHQELDPLACMVTAMHVPENKPVLEMLELFKGTAMQMVFVVDEFGGFQGIVTQNDVLEAIAGDMPEEHETEEPPHIQSHEDGSYEVDGRTDVDELRDYITLPRFNEGDFHTVGGMVLHVLQNMPETGEVFEIEGWQVTVVAMDGNRVEKVRFAPKADD
ncbi:MAG: TerC family protein [Alphaproteobacteria bacterium]|nr:TerC family protein [Alphaproteobacteria bacterium]